jgi:hypothetical protein
MPSLILAPGFYLALLFHTPDIHGGVGFIRTVMLGNFLFYFVLATSLAELLLRRGRSVNGK